MLKIYSASWCTYCQKLKSFLKNNNIEYSEIDIDENIDEAMFLIEKDLKTIPQVFKENGEYIGGCDDTIKMFEKS